MKKTALLLFMLFAFVMKAQETFYITESADKNEKYYIYPKTVVESERPGYITSWFLFGKIIVSGGWTWRISDDGILAIYNMAILAISVCPACIFNCTTGGTQPTWHYAGSAIHVCNYYDSDAYVFIF